MRATETLFSDRGMEGFGPEPSMQCDAHDSRVLLFLTPDKTTWEFEEQDLCGEPWTPDRSPGPQGAGIRPRMYVALVRSSQ